MTMTKFLDIDGLKAFKEKLLALIEDNRDSVVSIQELVDLYNGYNGTDLDYRDYLHLTVSEVRQCVEDFGTAYENGGS
jgi:hypothetical protein